MTVGQVRRRARLRARGRRGRGAAETGDGLRAWLVLRHVEAYEAAWRALLARTGGAPPAREPGPFPIRIQTPADLEAAAFELLAWADPRERKGPRSVFWIQPGMAEGVIVPDAEPLAPLLAAGEATVEGLRLLSGGLVLKVEHGDAVVQVRLRDAGRFPDGGGIEIRHRFALGMPQSVPRLLEFWNAVGCPAPRKGRGWGVRIAHWQGCWTG